MALAHFQRAGHRPIAVSGGGTGMIGDPSGCSTERWLLPVADIERNLAGIRQQFARYLDFAQDRAPAAEPCGLPGGSALRRENPATVPLISSRARVVSGSRQSRQRVCREPVVVRMTALRVRGSVDGHPLVRDLAQWRRRGRARRSVRRRRRRGRCGWCPALAVWFSHIVTPRWSATSWPLGANHWPAEQQPPGWGHDDGEQGAVTM
jgi:hypothetical protein